MSTERVIVDKSIAGEFEKALKTAAEGLRNERFELVRGGQVGEIKAVVDEAVSGVSSAIDKPHVLFSTHKRSLTKQGARLILGQPSSLQPQSSSTSPIVLAGVPTNSKAYTDESFAPMLILEEANDTAHAVELANSHPTGLSASIFTSDIPLALSVARKLKAGSVHINSMTVHDEHSLPFGGSGDSGWGKFNGRGAVESFTWCRNIRLGSAGGEKGMLPLRAL